MKNKLIELEYGKITADEIQDQEQRWGECGPECNCDDCEKEHITGLTSNL